MRKLTLLLLTLALLLSAGTAAAQGDVYDQVYNALYRIVLRTDTEDVTLGSGVLFLDQSVILTAEGCLREGALYAIGSDGEHAVQAMEKAGESGAALLQLATPSSAQPMTLANYDASTLPYIFGTDAKGKTGMVPLYQVLYGMIGGREALVLSGEEGLLPGAVTVDEKGALVGLVVSQRMEGMGMYSALEPDGLYAFLTGDTSKSFLPLELSWRTGFLTITWKDQQRQSGLYVITLSGAENVYYTSYEQEISKKSIDIAVAPGHTYYVQVQWAESADAALEPDWSAMTTYTVPALPLTWYGFSQECHLSSAPAGQEITQLLPEMTLISVDTLTDPASSRYLQVTSRYDTDGEFQYPMTLTLIGPDGQFYCEEMAFTFSEEYEADDTFVLPVDDLLASCAQFSGGTLQAGDYRLCYSVAGYEAGEYAFTVLPAGTQAPAPADVPEDKTSGFLRDLTAVNENGLVTVSWDAKAIPEGAKVSVYYVYDGNTYYTYHDMTEGSDQTEVLSVPGRGMMLWAAWYTGEMPTGLPADERDIHYVPAQAEKPFGSYVFRNLRCSLAPSADPDAAAKMEYLPAVPLTREILSDRTTPIYFQTEDVYAIDLESPDHPLALVLCTPEGLCFVDPGYYTFAPEYASSDLWLKDVSALFADYESMVHTGAWPAGEYTLLYCIDGQIAARFVFTLE